MLKYLFILIVSVFSVLIFLSIVLLYNFFFLTATKSFRFPFTSSDFRLLPALILTDSCIFVSIIVSCIEVRAFVFSYRPGIILINVRRKRHAKPQKTYKSVSAAHCHRHLSRSWCHTQTVYGRFLCPEEKSTASASDHDKKEQTTPDSAQNTVSPSETSTPVPTEAPSASDIKVSDEAASGVWTSSGSSWLFMVDGKPYTGWLTDTDGKKYYFNKDGIMQTGWVNSGGRRYYMDLDGIMQTGIITVDGKSYELLDDGSLKGYKAKAKKAAPTPTAEAKTSGAQTSASRKKADKYIALTFDDGPSSFTNRLLDCLEKNNAKATFFMVGKEIDSFPDEVKRMESLGCELGNHTYSHVDLTTLSPEDMSAEIAGVDEDLVNLVGHGAFYCARLMETLTIPSDLRWVLR